jgi:hypothetical protein
MSDIFYVSTDLHVLDLRKSRYVSNYKKHQTILDDTTWYQLIITVTGSYTDEMSPKLRGGS